MENYLHAIFVRIFAVKAARSVAMGFRRLDYRDVMPAEKLMPRIHLCGRLDNKTDMVKPLRTARRLPRTMQSQIVIAGTQIEIVGIRSPLYRHTQQIHVERLAGFQLLDAERDVSYTTGRFGSLHGRVNIDRYRERL